ncbi:AMP-binding protein, partial [Corallococcus caeni]
PKAVAISHRSAAAMLFWARDCFSPEERSGVLASTSVCFDLSVFELFVPLCFGGSVVLADNALQLPSHPAASHVTLLNTVPSALSELLRGAGLPPSVRTVNLAGEPLPRALVSRAFQVPTLQRLFNLYGPSEDTTYSTWALLDADATGTPPIGRAIANSQVYLLDRFGQPTPFGVPG